MLVAGSTHRPEDCLTPEAEPARECRQKGGLGCEELTYFLESTNLSVASLGLWVGPWKGSECGLGRPSGGWLPPTPSWSTQHGHQSTGPETLQAPLGWLLHLCLVISAQYCQPGLVGTQCEEVAGFRGAWPGKGC